MNAEQKKNTVKLGLFTITSFVVANMIGTGVFTSLGFQLMGIKSAFAIIALWIMGGVIALCGSLVYGELGAAMPRSGGEYNFLSRIYHPVAGFLAGWISITVGFAAPVALASMALGLYTNKVFPDLQAMPVGIITLIIITAVHSWDVKKGSGFQNIFTIFKVLLIIAFIICGFAITPQFQNISLIPDTNSWNELATPAFAVSLIYVTYAYSGWNASSYIAGEMKSPSRLLPKSLLIGTIIVSVLYILLNYTFLLTAPAADMEGQVDVGYISANYIFGETGGNIMGMLISFLLISSISSMVFVGPRVSQVMGEDYKLLKFLSFRNRKSVPIYAIILQSIISLFMILTGSFEAVLTYTGFTLNLFTFLTVAGVFVHRFRFPDAERPYKTLGYPVVPIIFLAIMGWTLFFLLKEKTMESLLGLATVCSGLIIYGADRLIFRNKPSQQTE
jgi:basic amino acid/polyamine antiporter, APA family